MGHPIVRNITLSAPQAAGLALTQSLGAAGPLLLNGPLITSGNPVVATLDTQRRVGITSGGNDTGITWTIVGTGRLANGSVNQPNPPLTETIAGANTGLTAQTTQDFSAVYSITGSGATASTVTAGTTGTASSHWVPWDVNALLPFQVSADGEVLSGSPTWQLDITYDDVQGLWLPPNITWPRAIAWPNLTGKTSEAFDIIGLPVRASRLTLTAYGSVQLTQTQQGN